MKQLPFRGILIASVILMSQGTPASADSAWQKIDEGLEFKAAQIDSQPYQTLIRLKTKWKQ